MNYSNFNVKLDSFDLLTVIGKGSYAKVILVKKRGSGQIYAMKILKKKYIQKKRQESHIMTERDVLAEVHHPFIVKMYYSFQNQKKLFFVLQYCPGGELFGLLSKKYKLSEQQAKFYAAQIVLALQYLHSKNIIYRDLKPENILIDAQGYLRLTDFGLSKTKVEKNDATTICGTPQYLAPEIISKQGHGKSVDWWCLGSIIFEMITGLPPFYSKNRNQLFDKIKYAKPNIPQHVSSKLRNLLEGLLQKKPQNRLGFKSSQELKKHPWFQKINWESILRKQIKPPFVPDLKSAMDTKYISPEFTECEVQSYSDKIINSDEQGQGKQYLGFSFQKDKSPNQMRLQMMQIEDEEEIEFEMKQMLQ